MRKPLAIVITGASSGIGEVLALTYAAPGVTLALGGRDRDRLAAVAERCRAGGATVTEAAIDVRDRGAMADWLVQTDDATPVDLVVANAGVSAGTGRGTESADQVRRIFEINLDGVLNTVLPLLPIFKQRGRGQIALMSSLAGFRGIPGSPAYCASKAAVKVWGEALRGELRASGIGVSVICPGYVRSRMTAVNRFPMPFLMDADRCARIIVDGLARDRARIAFPWPMAFAAWLGGTLPPSWTDGLLAKLPRKD